MADYRLHQLAAAMVRDAGGQVIGRTRLQKATYLMQLAGFADDFVFEYKHYGPFSEDLAEAMEIAAGLSLVHEDVRQSDWGGRYSIYRLNAPQHVELPLNPQRTAFVSAASRVGAIELELAATAAFLFEEGQSDPWGETARRKPDKAADGRLEKAKDAYRHLSQIPTPRPLPAIA